MLRLIFVLCLVSGCFESVLAHQGHSEAYKEYLNQPKPGWLSIGEPIKVEPVEVDQKKFLESVDEDQELKVTRYAVSLPQKDITIKFDHSVRGWHSWGNARKKWLSPDGRMLVVNTGGGSRMYEILDQGSYREIEFDFPKLTFDSGKRGEIYGWRWASNEVLLAESEIENEDTGEHENNRVYAYHWEEKVLSRLDLESLNIESLEGVEIIDVSQDANYLKINIGGDTHALKADLKSVPNLFKKDAIPKRPERVEPPKTERNPFPSLLSNKLAENEVEPVTEKSNFPWIIAGVLLVGTFALLLKIFKSKSAS